MRLSVRALGFAIATATILGTGAGTGAVAVPVSASAVETPSPEAAKSEIVQARVDAKELRLRDVRARVVSVAKNQIGDRYSAGSSGPSAFDCSGFTRYVYRVAAGKDLPHYSRAQYAKVKKIPLKQAQPGDLVFFLRNGAHHVGIYLGNGRMVDAAGTGKGVRISPISGSWWSRTFTGIGRILPA